MYRNVYRVPVPHHPRHFGGFGDLGPLTTGLIGAGIGFLGGKLLSGPGFSHPGVAYGPGFGGGYGYPGAGFVPGPGISGYGYPGVGFGSGYPGYGPGYY